MRFLKDQRAYCAAIAFLCLVGTGFAAQTASPKAKKQVSTIEDAKAYREAMTWFKQAEAMIGTPQENSEEQAELFRKALAIKSDFLEAHYNLGLIYANQKKMKQAAAEFEAVLKLEPKFDQGILVLLASAYEESGNTPAAIGALQKALARNPKDLKVLRALAYLQFNNKEDAAAIKILQQIIAAEPNDLSSHMDLALLFQRNNDIAKAAGHYQEAVRIDPKNFEAHYYLASIYMQQNNSDKAAAELEAANELKPGDAELLEKLGDVYALQQRHAKAAVAYKAALDKVSGRSALYAKYGFSLSNTNRTEEAVAALESAAKLNDKNADIFFLLGDLYSDLKKFDEAAAAYGKSLEINPKQKEVHFNLGTLFAEQKKFDEAMAELKLALKLDPNYSAAWANLALVAENLELDKDAIQAHEKVVALGKGQALNYFHLGVLYTKANQTETAIASFARAIEMEPDKYRALLQEELKKVHSVLDPIRYKESFTRLLNSPPNK
ncbi:MAG: tetratricopeptide repeat protein [Acidobacteria bacterium]|jgi:tetratricopeptide (TPR) repeat protein|nr:tetratricopeptide repeat protein [Acidobacteriota bacterium]